MARGQRRSMGLTKRFYQRLPSWRSAIAVVALGSYLAVAGGIPLPAPRISRDTRPFPCQHHQCGCHSAEQCWQHCCCYSPAERRAWARAHGMEADAIAAERAAQPTSAVHASTACCEHHDRHAPHHTKQRNRPPGPASGISGFHALGCQGIAMLWVTCGAVAPLPLPVPGVDRPTASGTVSLLVTVSQSAEFAPPDPPPRLPSPI